MIYGKLTRLERLMGINRNLDAAIVRLQTTDLSALPLGKTTLITDAVYVNRVNYETRDESVMEAHFNTLDIHIVLAGEERIGVADVNGLTEIKRDETEDYRLLSGRFDALLTLRPGDFLIAFPEDAHTPKLPVNGLTQVEKAIVKVYL